MPDVKEAHLGAVRGERAWTAESGFIANQHVFLEKAGARLMYFGCP
jgi:hypothetical protein